MRKYWKNHHSNPGWIIFLVISIGALTAVAQQTSMSPNASLNKLMSGLSINFTQLDTNYDGKFDCKDDFERFVVTPTDPHYLYRKITLESGRKIPLQCKQEKLKWTVAPLTAKVFKQHLTCTDQHTSQGQFFIIFNQPVGQILPDGKTLHILATELTIFNGFDFFTYLRKGYESHLARTSPFGYETYNSHPRYSTLGHVMVFYDQVTHITLTSFLDKAVKDNPLATFSLSKESSVSCGIPSKFDFVHVTHQGRTKVRLHELITAEYRNAIGSPLPLSKRTDEEFSSFMDKYKNRDSEAMDYTKNNIQFEIIPSSYTTNIFVPKVTLSDGQTSEDVYPQVFYTPHLVKFSQIEFKPDTEYTLTIENAFVYFSKTRIKAGVHGIRTGVGLSGLACQEDFREYLIPFSGLHLSTTCHKVFSGPHSIIFKTAPEDEFYSRSIGE